MFMQTRGLLDPLRKGLSEIPKPFVVLAKNTTRPVKDFFVNLYQLRNIAKENSNLAQKNLELMKNLADYQQLQIENSALRKELGFIKSNNLNLQPCTVISQSQPGLVDSIILNCGTNDGVQPGAGVLSQGFLVGKIVYVSNEFSTALLITSSQFSTDAKVSNNNVAGVVKGSYGSGFYIDELPQATNIDKNTLVVTAGINSKIPKNLLIGQVVQITSKDNDLFKNATLSSPVDVDNLEFVFVTK